MCSRAVLLRTFRRPQSYISFLGRWNSHGVLSRTGRALAV
jgi:hypothetical protein